MGFEVKVYGRYRGAEITAKVSLDTDLEKPAKRELIGLILWLDDCGVDIEDFEIKEL